MRRHSRISESMWNETKQVILEKRIAKTPGIPSHAYAPKRRTFADPHQRVRVGAHAQGYARACVEAAARAIALGNKSSEVHAAKVQDECGRGRGVV